MSHTGYDWIIVDGACEAEDTELARCFTIGDETYWIPDSVIGDVIFDDHEPTYPVAVQVAMWFIKKKGLEQYLRV